MEFTVPQFIEREPKIVGPFTFKQFIYVGVAGGLCLFLFFIVPLPLPLFVIIALILLGGAFALAFLKVGRTSLPVFLKNFFIFSVFRQKIYLWHKKATPPKFLKPEKEEPEEKTEEDELKKPVLKINAGSRLKELFTRLETK